MRGSAGEGTALAVTSVASVQFGAAIATHLFPLVGPFGAVALRLLVAALALVALTRPWRLAWSARDLRSAVLFGGVLVVMNASLYVAIDRLPLATAITIEFLGPLAVSVATARSWRQRIWAVPAAVGVLLLGGSLHAADLVGILAALAAAVGWASYILVSRRVGRSDAGLGGLALASLVGAAIMVPVGVVTQGSALWHPHALGLAVVVGLASSALPYSLDLLALRRLPTAVFGVLTSLNPAVAALAGFAVLGERLPAVQLLGVGFVVVASAGITLAGVRRRRHAPARPRVARASGSGPLRTRRVGGERVWPPCVPWPGVSARWRDTRSATQPLPDRR